MDTRDALARAVYGSMFDALVPETSSRTPEFRIPYFRNQKRRGVKVYGAVYGSMFDALVLPSIPNPRNQKRIPYPRNQTNPVSSKPEMNHVSPKSKTCAVYGSMFDALVTEIT